MLIALIKYLILLTFKEALNANLNAFTFFFFKLHLLCMQHKLGKKAQSGNFIPIYLAIIQILKIKLLN